MYYCMRIHVCLLALPRFIFQLWTHKIHSLALLTAPLPSSQASPFLVCVNNTTILYYMEGKSSSFASVHYCETYTTENKQTNKQTNKQKQGRLGNKTSLGISQICSHFPTHTQILPENMITHTLTVLLAMMTIGIVSSSSCSRTILALSCLRLYQLERELIANIARKPSPFEREVSRNSINSSCPAVSMISTSCWSKPYSIWVM